MKQLCENKHSLRYDDKGNPVIEGGTWRTENKCQYCDYILKDENLTNS